MTALNLGICKSVVYVSTLCIQDFAIGREHLGICPMLISMDPRNTLSHEAQFMTWDLISSYTQITAETYLVLQSLSMEQELACH